MPKSNKPVDDVKKTSREKDQDDRDQISDQRDIVSDQRDILSDQRDIVSDKRDVVSDRRDVVSDRRDAVADRRHRVSRDFEQSVTDALRAQDLVLLKQDHVLSKIELKMDSPVLNGGFDNLTRKIDKLELLQEQIRGITASTNDQVREIHTTIYHPERGLIVISNEHAKWIKRINGSLKWFMVMLATGLLTGVGKVIYDVVIQHLHYHA